MVRDLQGQVLLHQPRDARARTPIRVSASTVSSSQIGNAIYTYKQHHPSAKLHIGDSGDGSICMFSFLLIVL